MLCNPEDAVCDYISRCKVQDKVSDKLIRYQEYTIKPRTTSEGYKGMASTNQKEPFAGGFNCNERMHLRTVQVRTYCSGRNALSGKLAICGDILSYVAVGARSVGSSSI